MYWSARLICGLTASALSLGEVGSRYSVPYGTGAFPEGVMTPAKAGTGAHVKAIARAPVFPAPLRRSGTASKASLRRLRTEARGNDHTPHTSVRWRLDDCSAREDTPATTLGASSVRRPASAMAFDVVCANSCAAFCI